MKNKNQENSVYLVHQAASSIEINGKWDKKEWLEIPSLDILHHMGEDPNFAPKTQAKLMYDETYIYGIFKVEDKFVKCQVQEINGPVSTDSCVEFFFSPDQNEPLKYFNLEINCSGVPLFHYVTLPRKEYELIDPEYIRQIEIAHSMPSIVDQEITENVTWTIEFKMPLNILTSYRNITAPAPGVTWKANFYKTGSKTSNPHYYTWNEVINPRPDFHLPQYFGTLEFQ